jgi:hypothetical protein
LNNPADRIGSGPANQSHELIVRNLPVDLVCHTADVRLDRAPTHDCRWVARSRRLEADIRWRRHARGIGPSDSSAPVCRGSDAYAAPAHGSGHRLAK